MPSIHVRGGFHAFVDPQDVELVFGHLWRLAKKPGGRVLYARTLIEGKGVLMHRLILGVSDPRVQVDHEDSDGLNNRRLNIRIATQVQNSQNTRKRLGCASQYKGVFRTANIANPWRAVICEDGIKNNLGVFPDEASAAQAYDDAARSLFTLFARPNFPQQEERHAA